MRITYEEIPWCSFARHRLFTVFCPRRLRLRNAAKRQAARIHQERHCSQYKAWIAATQRKDSDANTALYDESAIILAPGEEPVVGRAAILDFYKKFNSGKSLLADEQFTPVALDVCGDLAIDVSQFSGHE